MPSPDTLDVLMTGASSRKVPRTKSLRSSSTSSINSSSARSHLVNAMTPRGMPRRDRIPRCSRVCGITPSSAATTRSARSIPPAPASILLTNFSCPGTSMMPDREPSGRSSQVKPSSMVMPLSFSSARRSGSRPVKARIREDLPWSTWPAVPIMTCFMADPSLR